MSTPRVGTKSGSLGMKIAICICTCNRPLLLDRVLGRVGGLVTPGPPPVDLFVVVVDNSSESEAHAVCERLRDRLPFPMHAVSEPRRGISHARNRAVEEALRHQADFIAFIDDDDLPDPDWLARLVETQRASGASLVFGYWRLPANTVLPDWMREVPLLQPSPFHARSRYGFPNWAGTYNILIGREVIGLLRDDGYVFEPADALLGGEDVDFMIRAVRRGVRTAQTEDSQVVRDWEPARMTVRGLLRRAYRGGVIRVAIDRRHLPRADYRRIRRRRAKAGPGLLLNVLSTPFHMLAGHRASAMRAWVDLARWCGEAAAALGFNYRYY